MTKEQDIELIETYWKGTLSAEDREDVESRLNADAEFAELFKAHTWTLDGFEGIKMEELEAHLRQIEVAPPGRSFRGWWYLLLVLLVALTLFVVIRELSLPDPASNAVLADAYYEAPVSLVERNADETIPDQLRQAFVIYSSGDWNNAAGQFASITAPELQSTAKYYEAHCRYQLAQYQEARTIFSNLADDREYGQQASWFEALCLLKEGAREQALDALESVMADDGQFYREQAEKLMTSLKKN